MNQYDGMSVHELVIEIAKDATAEVVSLMNADISYEVKREEIESFFLRAVIREASVGNVVISTDDIHETHFAAYSRDCGLIGDCGVADGAYELIPKENL